MGAKIVDENTLNWNEVIEFFSKKYISSRAAFMGSEATINQNAIEVNLKSKSKFMMLQRNMDKLISDFVMNSTGKRYEVKFLEPDVMENSLSNSKQDELIKKIFEENAFKVQATSKNSSTNGSDMPQVNQMPKGYGHSASPADGMDDAYLDSLANSAPNFDVQNSVEGTSSIPSSKWQNSQQGAWQGNGGQRRQPKKRNLDMVEDPERLIFKGWRDTQNPKFMKIIDFSPEQPGVIIKGKTSN